NMSFTSQTPSGRVPYVEHHPVNQTDFFAEVGEMAERCRTFDWARTALGPVDRWPPSLRTAVAVVLRSGFPTILVWGPELVQIYNDAYSSLIGLKHPGALGMPTHECWPEIRHLQEPIFARVFGGETINLKDAHYALDRSGTIEDAYFDASFVPVPLEDNQIGGSLSTLFETTDRVKARADAIRGAAELSAVVGSIPEAVYIGTTAGLTMVNAGALAETRCESIEQLNGKSAIIDTEMQMRDAKTDAPIDPSQRPFTRALRGETLIQDVLVRDRRTREDRVLRSAAGPVLVDGAVVAAVVVNTDITDYVAAGHEANERAARLRLAMDSSDQGAWSIDLVARVRWHDARVNEIFGLPRKEGFLGLDEWEHYIHADDRVGMRTAIEGAIALVGRYAVEYRVVWPDGTVRWVGSLGQVLPTDDGVASRVVGTLQDITERREAAAERERLFQLEQQARVEAEAANQSKSDFLAVMSHELRTPLNAIGGYAELMELGIRGPVTQEQRTDLARIQTAQRHLLGLVTDVLNFVRVDRGRVEYALTDVSVEDVLAGVETLVRQQFQAKGITYTPRPCPQVRVVADEEKLGQIFINLLTNALKFTPEGGEVVVNCDTTDQYIEIQVSDTGIGIHAAKLEAIFEPFVQVDQQLTRANNGVGLGLAISRDLARGMGGDLTAASVVGVGSTFTLKLLHPKI
ncbi:MAG: HAMP domain-containing sensor histidine kinase, partial [Gemmatimonadales bacterium]